jgi:GT2 family glycosyltransferase
MAVQQIKEAVPAAPTGQVVPRILAIVVTHNGRPWFKEALISLDAQTYSLMDVLVVDDASPDARQEPSLKRIAKRHVRRRRWGYLRTPRPLGYGGAINWALSRVRTDVDLLLFIHDDAALERDAVRRMTARMVEQPGTAVVGPKIVSWADTSRLEEIGMRADRFGYPYKGLEEGEIDLGQHDTAGEVFFVTSTCMLVRHDVFRDLRGWDARLRAFSEDLDLCWRARLAGYSVWVEPRAIARHAIALARGERKSPFSESRYFNRRNRLRTVFKNASGLRLLVLVPQFLLLTVAEGVGFVVLRQPREILNLGRALFWNLLSLPQTLSERTRIQRRRKISDRGLRRLTVRQSTRVRAYVTDQRERLEEIWGRRAAMISDGSLQARLLGKYVKSWVGIALVLTVLALLLGFRHVWWSAPISVGEILPYPDRPTALWRAFFSPWRGVGLGQPGPHPPALALLGLVPLLTFGAAAVAQKLLLLGLGVVSFVGAYRLVTDLVDRSGRFAAGAIYLLGTVGYAGVRNGALGALVFGAAAPFVLRSMIRIAGWVRPPDWHPERAVARVGLAGAISAAFVPGALFLYVATALFLAVARALFVSADRAVRRLLVSIAGLVVGWALLLPWSAQWFFEGGPLRLLTSDERWRTYAASFAGHDMASVVLGQTPEGPVLFGLALPLLGLIPVIAGKGQRRRLAFALWGLVVMIGWFVTLTSAGLLRPLVASPVEAGVLAALAFSGLVGLAVATVKHDLPRTGVSPMRVVVSGVLAVAIFLIAAGLGPALLRGDWGPGQGTERATAEETDQVRSLLNAEAKQAGQFRALWVGEDWTAPIPSSARPPGTSFVTGPRGQVLSDLFERRGDFASKQFRRVLQSVVQGTTDRGGALLGAFNVRYVILDRSEATDSWLDQRDLEIVREDPGYLLLENQSQVVRAALYERLPVYVRAVQQADPAISTEPEALRLELLKPDGSNRFFGADSSGPGTIFLAEARDSGWEASFGGSQLEPVPGGWGNAFKAPSEAAGPIEVVHPLTLEQVLIYIVSALAWVVVVGAAFSRRRPQKVGVQQ